MLREIKFKFTGTVDDARDMVRLMSGQSQGGTEYKGGISSIIVDAEFEPAALKILTSFGCTDVSVTDAAPKT